MATRQETADFLLDQLAALPTARARKMFGEYALYVDEKVVALVCDDQLFLKPTPAGHERLGPACPEGSPYHGAKPHLVPGADVLEDDERLVDLLRATAAALPVPKPKKPPRPR